jgi:hypothetical protein
MRVCFESKSQIGERVLVEECSVVVASLRCLGVDEWYLVRAESRLLIGALASRELDHAVGGSVVPSVLGLPTGGAYSILESYSAMGVSEKGNGQSTGRRPLKN